MDFRGGFNLLHFIATVHAMAILPFIRKDFGTHYFGIPGFFCLVLMLLLVGSIPGMLQFLCVWIALIAIHRFRAVRKAWQGEHEHSHYSGWPWLALIIPGIRTEMRAKCVECLISALAGFVLWDLGSEDLGKFVLVGCFTLPFTLMISWAFEANRVRRMRDASIEHRQMAQRYRDGRGTW